ncbi:helix-turn-helix domain-containing protein [Clostridioides difficile]
MFRFPSVICTRCTGFFCLAIIKGPPNDIYCIIEEPSKHYFTEKVSYSRFSTLNAICEALDCQPGDILEYQKDIEK